MTDKIIQNAIIESVSLNFSDHGILSGWLNLNFGGVHQGFGGYALYLPKSSKYHSINSNCGHFIFRCLQIAGVTDWSKIVGKAIRVHCSSKGLDSDILGIGHIINDDWFYPREDFKKENV